MTDHCHWSRELGWLTPEHRADCKSADCAGCRPCPKTHCAMHGKCANHVDVAAGISTCPGCIRRTRQHLDRIATLYATDIQEEAEESGVDSEAFYLVGPAAAPDQYAARKEWNDEVTEAGDWRRGWCSYPREDDHDGHHPYLVLGRWDMALREQYGPQTDLFVTVESSGDYLRKLLDGPFPHGDEFERFALEIAQCANHMEAVAHRARVPERGRPCPRCVEADGKGPRLRKRYAKGTDEQTRRGENDTWHCPADAEHWWSEVDYRRNVDADYLDYASALTADQISQRLGVKAGTVRVWATRGHVRKRGKDQQGRQLYDVADVERHAGGESMSA